MKVTKMYFKISCLLIGLITISVSVNSERLHGQMYSTINGAAACFRRLNGTHQAGCTSPNSGSVGIVHMVNHISDANWIVFNSTGGSYVAVISSSLFNSVIDLFLISPQNVAGVLLYESVNETTNYFSQDSRCPNEYMSAENSQCSSEVGDGITWNEHGTGVLRRDIPFPIFYLPKSHYEEITKINACFQRFNTDKENQKGKPLCSIQLKFFMFAAVNSEVCMRRSTGSMFLGSVKICDPLGDLNVYYSLFPRAKESETGNRTVTFVTARLDATSLFDGLAPGAASSAVGVVSLITTAATLAKMIPSSEAKNYKHNVIWTLLNGEAFDYIGSQRIAYDLSRGAWPSFSPLTTSQIKLHLELGQLGGGLNNADNSWDLHAFAAYPKGSTEVPVQISDFLKSLNNGFQNIEKNISVVPQYGMNLPPSSLHSFRRILKAETESGDLPELLLVDHKETFTNHFYNSVLDNGTQIGYQYHNITIDDKGTFIDTDELIAKKILVENDMQVKIARLSTALSRTLYEQVTGTAYTGNVQASAHLVDEILYCLLNSQACKLLMAADFANSGGANREGLPQVPVSLYVSVNAVPNPASVFAGHLLALLTGDTIDANRTSCAGLNNQEHRYFWLRGWNNTGVCIQTTMNFTQAVSPAFIIPDYDMSLGTYSTWTESIWQAMSIRLFVVAGGGGAAAAWAAGAFTSCLALFLTYWLKRHAHIVFAASPSANLVTIANQPPGILRTVNC